MRATIKAKERISTVLLGVLAVTATVVVLGLLLTSVRLVEIQTELSRLQASVLPRLVKLAQLSQEASATSSIAPALGMRPTPAEFDTLLSRIKDKESAQRILIDELGRLIEETESAQALQQNGDLLIANLRGLTAAVGEQIAVAQRLEDHAQAFTRLQRLITAAGSDDTSGLTVALTRPLLLMRSTLLDGNRSRFAPNRRELEASMAELEQALAAVPAPAPPELATTARDVLDLWHQMREALFADKAAELANTFRIKALAEENSLIANRLLSSASNAFWQTRMELEERVQLVNGTIRLTLGAVVLVLLVQAAGTTAAWRILKRRVFERLHRMSESLRDYANDRHHGLADRRPDEIGAISGAMAHYMDVIDQRETELAAKTSMLEQLSTQLAKYLSPQVYESIFTGKQQVRIASSRKKLTIFFSDIVGFTEIADQLESEELTQLLNQYLTEMSRTALAHGATIDKYVGDGILIFFGDPETKGVREDALACVRMAIAMRGSMYDLGSLWRAAGIGNRLQIRMGIHTGFCTVGNFGSDDRMDYTIVGGAVNIAARLEELAAPGEILLSFETVALIESEIDCEPRGTVEVKGIAHPIQTYRVAERDTALGPRDLKFKETLPHFRLEIDPTGMTDADQQAAREVLGRALALLDSRTEVPPEDDV